MKRISLIILAGLMLCNVFAQQPAKGSSLGLSVYVPDVVEPVPLVAQTQLENKLHLLLTKNGISSVDYANQFVLTAIVTPLTKDVLPGPPMQIAEQLEITFYIADVLNKKVFATTSLTTRGVGSTDAKCYLDALKRINLASPALQKFLADGRAEIIEYYDANAEKMFARARALAKQHKFEEALFIITTIPDECKHYDAALACGNEIFDQYNTYLCNIELAQARAAWVAGQNALAAAEAGEYLAKIYPDAGCYEDAMALYEEIKGKVLDDWKFEMKKYQDGVDLEKARINSWRDIGVAYGENQPKETTNIEFLRSIL